MMAADGEAGQGGAVSVLRAQIEMALRDELRRRRELWRRWAVIAALGLVCATSLALNVLVMASPGSVGLPTSANLEQTRQEVDALRRMQVVDRATVNATVRRIDRTTSAALAALCGGFAKIGSWSFQTSTAPAGCPATAATSAAATSRSLATP